MQKFSNLFLRSSILLGKFIFIVYASKTLTSEQFGYYILIGSSLVYLVGLIGLEFHAFSNRKIINDNTKISHHVSNHIICGILALSFVLIFLWLSDLSLFFAGEHSIAFLFLIFFDYLCVELSRLLNSLELQIQSSTMLFIRSVFWMIPFMIFIESGYYQFDKLSVLIYFWIGGCFLSLFFGIRCIAKRVSIKSYYISFPWIINGIKNAAPIFLMAQLTLFTFFIDKILISHFDSIKAVGSYGFNLTVAFSLITFMEAAVFVFFVPKAVRMYANKNFEELNKLLNRILIYTVGAVIIYGSFILVCYDYFAGYFNISSSIYEFLLIYSFCSIMVLSMVYHYVLYASGKDKELLKISLISVFLFFIMFFISHIYMSALYAVVTAMTVLNTFLLLSKCYIWNRVVKNGLWIK